MPLTLEDGSVVSGADTYVSRADFITYAASKGVTVADEAASDVYLFKAAQYIDHHESGLKGDKTTRDQAMSYPRANLVLDGFTWDSDEIPRQVILCQQELALDLIAGIDIWNRPQSKSQGVKRQRVEGAVEVEYAVGDGMRLSRQSSSIALLNSLLRNSGLLSVAISMG